MEIELSTSFNRHRISFPSHNDDAVMMMMSVLTTIRALSERIALSGAQGICLENLTPQLSPFLLQQLILSGLFQLRDDNDAEITISRGIEVSLSEKLWQRRDVVRIVSKHAASISRARGITCREDIAGEGSSPLIDLVARAGPAGVLLADLNKESGATPQAGRLSSLSLLTKRRVKCQSASGGVHSFVLHLKRFSRLYDPETQGHELEVDDETRRLLVAAITEILRANRVNSMSYMELSKIMGISLRSGYAVRDLFSDAQQGKDDCPLITYASHEDDKAKFAQDRWFVGLRDDSSSPDEGRGDKEVYGSACVRNLPLFEQAAILLRESLQGLASNDFSLLCGLDRKRTGRLVSALTDVYKVPALKHQEGKQQVFRLSNEISLIGGSKSTANAERAHGAESRKGPKKNIIPRKISSYALWACTIVLLILHGLVKELVPVDHFGTVQRKERSEIILEHLLVCSIC